MLPAAMAPRKTRLGRASRAGLISDETVGIVGTGAFGTALASLISAHNKTAVLYTESRQTRDEINRHHRNTSRLPGVSLAKRVAATGDPGEIAGLARVIVLAVPSVAALEAVEALAPHLGADHVVAHAIGGFVGGQRRISQVLEEKAPEIEIAALAGPALPRDLCARRSSALVAASKSDRALEQVKQSLQYPPTLRVYKSRDLLGVELASAISAALAVVIGIADGFGVGEGPRTVLLTRAIAEGAQIGATNGAKERTFYGMAGLGNLLGRVSSSSRRHSKDYQIGFAIGRGDEPQYRETEGTRSLATVARLAQLVDLDAPICTMMNQVVRGDISVEVAADRLASWEADLE